MIKDILITKLNVMQSNDGSVLHGIKKTDNGFMSFGETYFSFINIQFLTDPNPKIDPK